MSQYFPKPYEPFGGDINVKADLSNYATKADIKNISHIENKIPDTSGLIKKTDYNTKITETEGKIPNVSNLATKTALTTVENKMPNVSSLVKIADYNTKMTEIDNKLNNRNRDKYITTPEFNTLAADVFNVRLARANLVAKTSFDNALSSLDSTISANKTKNEPIENELKKLKTFDLSYFIGKGHFEDDGTQNYLVFQQLNKYFKIIANKKYISSWQSKGLSDQTIKSPATSDNSLTPLIDYYGAKRRVRFTGNCLKQPKNSYTHRTIVNNYIVYELGASSSHNNDPTLQSCLFGAVTYTKNADIDKYGCSGYGIGFDRRSHFSFPGGRFDQNILIFGVDMSFSAHIDSKKKKTY